MEYYNLLNLKIEPFSNSPEPDFLFQSPQHTGCLQKLELAVRFRRGLNVVIGDVGTGKTTLCRKLIQSFCSTPEDSEKIETHLLLDPAADNALEFLRNVAGILNIQGVDGRETEWQLKEKIKDYLFIKGVTENKIVVLIIDEGQKIPESCLEVLREFLNYETNDFKLLQIIIFAQKEFKAILQKRENLTDRINLFYYLQPLNFTQMRAMINYRISVARNLESGPELLSFGAMMAIYLSTGGYPRKVVFLCHQVLLMLIIREQKKAGFFFVRKSWKEMMKPLLRKKKWAEVSLIAIIVMVMAAGLFVFRDQGINLYQQFNVSKIIPEAKQKSMAQTVPVPAVSTSSAPQAQLIIPEKEKEEIKRPDSLGILTAKTGMNLWQITKNIYGEVNPEITNKVNNTNAHINNKDLIMVGEQITIPAIPFNINPVGKGSLIVVLEKGNDINAVYYFFYDNINNINIPPMVFLPFWNSKEGLTFAVAIDKSFTNVQEAQATISKLPDPVAAGSKIVSQWNEGTVFFNSHVFNH